MGPAERSGPALEGCRLDGRDEMPGTNPVQADLACDFCHARVSSVRRVALDGDYERLTTPPAVQYACPDCFEYKDRVRLGLAPAG